MPSAMPRSSRYRDAKPRGAHNAWNQRRRPACAARHHGRRLRILAIFTAAASKFMRPSSPVDHRPAAASLTSQGCHGLERMRGFFKKNLGRCGDASVPVPGLGIRVVGPAPVAQSVEYPLMSTRMATHMPTRMSNAHVYPHGYTHGYTHVYPHA